ncbi:MAG: SRPBCC family protein [Pseudomonadota bacterium]|uniref:SRPBCC family protein n=1 Tax=Sphingomonas sp. ERG5 TaxID=1381597 RepID=UPI00068FBBCA|nr:SRPBCC family protein [Sphingomonas sp. ERG5]
MTIRWPDGFAPANSPVHVVNRIETATNPQIVWRRLIRAADWPLIYANASKVKIEGGGADLFAGAHFTWRTFGVALKTRVTEFDPETRIAWLAESSGVRAYHAWLITPRDGGGCTILTEETQHGLIARAGRLLFPRRMEHWHQKWLEALSA